MGSPRAFGYEIFYGPPHKFIPYGRGTRVPANWAFMVVCGEVVINALLSIKLVLCISVIVMDIAIHTHGFST